MEQVMQLQTKGHESSSKHGGKLTSIYTETSYVNILDNCSSDDKPEDIWKVHDINNEGFARKAVRIIVETEIKLVVLGIVFGV
jgi:hypothetical protein